MEQFAGGSPLKGAIVEQIPMTTDLPVNPATIDPSDRGERRAELEMTHKEAVEHVRGLLKDAGFGIATEFVPSKMVNEKVDAERDPYTVLGACSPAVADDALEETANEIGGLFSCNVAIWETEEGAQVVYHVSIMKVARLVGLAPNTAAWGKIIERTGSALDDVWERL